MYIFKILNTIYIDVYVFFTLNITCKIIYNLYY